MRRIEVSNKDQLFDLDHQAKSLTSLQPQLPALQVVSSLLLHLQTSEQLKLPKNTLSGLVHSLQVLKDIDDVVLVEFDSKDVVRHGLVQKIVEAYGKYKK